MKPAVLDLYLWSAGSMEPKWVIEPGEPNQLKWMRKKLRDRNEVKSTEERFALLVDLGKKITDFGSDDKSAVEQENIDKMYSINVQFEESSEEGDEDVDGKVREVEFGMCLVMLGESHVHGMKDEKIKMGKGQMEQKNLTQIVDLFDEDSEMSFHLQDGCLMTDEIKAFFGDNITGLSYKLLNSTFEKHKTEDSNGLEAKQKLIFISVGDKESIKLEAGVKKCEVHYKRTRSTVELGNSSRPFPFFHDHAKEPQPVDFRTFYNDKRSGIKHVNGASSIYLYATANDTFRRQMITNEFCRYAESKQESDQEELAVTAEQPNSQGIKLEKSKDELQKKRDMYQSMKVRIRESKTSPKTSSNLSAAKKQADLAKRFSFDSNDVAILAGSMEDAMNTVGRAREEANSNPASVRKVKIPKTEKATHAAVGSEIVLLSPGEDSGSTRILIPKKEKVAHTEESEVIVLTSDDDSDLILSTTVCEAKIKKEPEAPVDTPAAHVSLSPSTKKSSKSSSSFDHEFDSCSNEPLHLCGGNGEIVVVHRNSSLCTPKEGQTATELRELISLGKGAYGDVYLGNFQGISVAIKEVHNARYQDTIDIVREIAISDRASRSPNVATLLAFSFDYDSSLGRLILELVEGGELRGILFVPDTELPKLDTVAKQVNIVKQLSAGIQYLHACKPPIIHGDLKPENIMVTQDFKLRICDFGSSHLDELPEQLELTEDTDLTKGTYIYLAPEVLIYDYSISEKSDVWATSCIILEVFLKKRSWTIGEIL
ncbi:hypothetical protein QAD02_003126 [Eretmocerus hayati]|uniref:Uncharacterized protein n=1 Tax=Eretmocerus hayati TaxID=131215 RepID=A0ACC2NL84_9HYME|nr:hypothetical protein QAD02_003126 [Eretmocerus hayati]